MQNLKLYESSLLGQIQQHEIGRERYKLPVLLASRNAAKNPLLRTLSKAALNPEDAISLTLVAELRMKDPRTLLTHTHTGKAALKLQESAKTRRATGAVMGAPKRLPSPPQPHNRPLVYVMDEPRYSCLHPWMKVSSAYTCLAPSLFLQALLFSYIG